MVSFYAVDAPASVRAYALVERLSTVFAAIPPKALLASRSIELLA
jgi:hypothetical protein